MAGSFHGLAAYRLAAALADDAYHRVARWPRFDQMTCGTQLVRAVDSVGANIAESSGRWHRGEKRQLLIIARGSLYETEHWLGRAKARGLMDGALDTRVDEVGRTLNGLIRRPTAS